MVIICYHFTKYHYMTHKFRKKCINVSFHFLLIYLLFLRYNAFIVFIWEETTTFEIIENIENVIKKENDLFFNFLSVILFNLQPPPLA